MKKQNIKKTLDDNYLYELAGHTLREAAAALIKLSEEYEEDGWENIRFDTDYNYDSTQLLINGSRLETDAEAIARAEVDARRAAASREHDLRVFKQTAERLGINIENIEAQ
jgi:hypothetical protein